MPAAAKSLDVDALLKRAEIIVCCGSGGVGKTTTAAAMALRAAEQGRNVCVLTIDPARRLAQSMGLTELDNTPRAVAGIDTSAGGHLDAMMLDMKRTFDDIVLTHSDKARAEAIFANPFYVSLSSSFSGTQEYMAMEKLGQLKAAGTWDLIVVDTPPSRSALDFLDAPQRLGRFLDGRMIRMLTAPARAGGRAYLKVFTIGVKVFTDTLNRVLGAQALKDLSLFVSSLDSLFGGFRERADQTYQLLKESGTSFIVVAVPERDALREAAYFVERLETERMPLAGLVLNRVHTSAATGLSVQRSLAAAEALDEAGNQPLSSAVLRVHAERLAAASRDARRAGRFRSAHPSVRVVEVAAQAGDVHDLDGLREIGSELSNGPDASAPGATVEA
ncbi:MAG TPA: ArsA-related P-loop ATPase [Mycobacteriales bacterium]|jgi:anion-transporting  ArsA/GET3 family ATPase|nr:ArsA-related P-loop ATPase [Mycobacteriales bacterium]